MCAICELWIELLSSAVWCFSLEKHLKTESESNFFFLFSPWDGFSNFYFFSSLINEICPKGNRMKCVGELILESWVCTGR